MVREHLRRFQSRHPELFADLKDERQRRLETWHLDVARRRLERSRRWANEVGEAIPHGARTVAMGGLDNCLECSLDAVVRVRVLWRKPPKRARSRCKPAHLSQPADRF